MGDITSLLELLWPMLILQVVLTIVALVAWFKTDQTKGPKWAWLLIILLVSIIGPILFFILGRRTD